MNERILELARQVWPDPSVSHVNHEKFAELIVQECVRKVRNRGGMCGALASNWIEEHFYGVEE